MPATQLLRRLTGSGLLITAVLSGGCATTAAPPVDPLVEEADTAPQSPELIPLPAAHLYLGPMTLRDALLTLAGPAWDVQVDDRARQICFVPAGEPSADPETDTPLAAPVQTFPIVDGGQP